MAVTYCNTTAILDSVMVELPDNSSTMRNKALNWLNQTIRDILNQPRVWNFLATTTTLPITSNIATLPAGAADITYIMLGSTYLDTGNQIDDETAQNGTLSGYTLSPDGTITFYPSTSETSCKVKYETGLSTKYTDSAIDTIFPIEFENVLISGTLMRCFKFDKDGRFTAETSLFQYQMKLVKEWDNKFKPLPDIYAKVSSIPRAASTNGAFTLDEAVLS